MKRLLLALVLLLSATSGLHAQTQNGGSRVDLLMGVDFNYRDIFYNNKLFELLVNLTPAAKWQFGDHWQVAAQGLIPVINDYGEHYKKVRLNMAVLSKEMHLGNQHLKLSGGIFSHERYGFDLKWMMPVTSWLAFDAQAGFTGYCTMAVDWETSNLNRFTGWLGTRAYLHPWNTEFRLRGGRFLYEDYGGIAEAFRHFDHCSIGIFGQWNERERFNGGFKIVMMIPPYSRKVRTVNIRPASNFRLSYNNNAYFYQLKMYDTDPEENEREGYFDRKAVQWGANTMAPDFREH
ncbi:MAG: hypothetical protein ACSW8D_01945 [Prevotella sp.]